MRDITNRCHTVAKSSYPVFLAECKLPTSSLIFSENDFFITKLIFQEGVYKYLGVDESDGIQHSNMKDKIRKEYNRRVRLILRTELNGRNKIEAVNSLAVPVAHLIHH